MSAQNAGQAGEGGQVPPGTTEGASEGTSEGTTEDTSGRMPVTLPERRSMPPVQKAQPTQPTQNMPATPSRGAVQEDSL